MVVYRRFYDSIIVDRMAKSYIYRTVDKLRRYRLGGIPIREDEPGEIKPHSFTDIYNIVKEKNPKVSKETIQTHLDRMIEEHTLERLPRQGERYNKTLYALEDKKMRMYVSRMYAILQIYGLPLESYSLIYDDRTLS